MRAIDRRHSDAILGAMRQVALAGGRPLSHADTASIRAAGHYLLRRPDLADIGTLPAVSPADLVAVLVKPDNVLGVVEEAAATGHRNLLILPGGFAEAGEAGQYVFDGYTGRNPGSSKGPKPVIKVAVGDRFPEANGRGCWWRAG